MILRIRLALTLVIAVLAMAGCARDTQSPEGAQAPAATTAPSAAPTAAEPVPSAVPAPTEAPTVAPEPAAAEPAPTSAPTHGGTLVRGMTSEPGQIDPQGAPSSGLSLVLPYLFDTLVVRDVDNSVLPGLAERWETADDGKAITLFLRTGVKFHDGTSLDAEAVVATFKRFQASGQKSPIYGGVKSIGGIEAVDPLTVRFTFERPAANFWSTITMPYAGIISPASLAALNDKGEGNLIGSGPFMLGEWKAGQSLTLMRNPDYAWGSELTANRAAPYLDEVVFKVIPDATTQLAALQNHEVDVIFVNEPSQRASLEANPDVAVNEAVLNSLVYLGFNTQKPPFDDARVRQAIAHAVNKAEVVDLALGGIGIAAFAPLPPTLPGFDPALKADELGFDADASARLLQEAGLTAKDGGWEREGQALKAVLLTSNRAPNDTIAALLQSQLKAIGLPVEIQQLDSKAVMQATTEGKFDLLLWRYDWNDPDALNIYLGSDRIGSTNRVGYSNAAVDKLLVAGAHELDEVKRIQLYVDAQKLILADAPWQPLYVPLDLLAISKRIEGAEVGYMGRLLLNDARVTGE